MTDNLMIKNLNIQLEHEIKQLNNYINGSTSLESHDSFKPSTSVRLPQSIDYYNKERKIFSEDKCNINHPKSINLQADMLHLEYVNIKKTDFNKQSMPSLILQHFEDKLYQICQAKLRCSIRWERYCKNSTLSSKMYPDYKKMMTLLLSEYDDTVVSLERLGSIREFCILEQYEKALNVINKNDLEVYIVWLTNHYYTKRTIFSLLKIMEYLPYKYKNKLMKGLKTTSDNEIVLEKSDYSLSKDVQLNTRSVVPICVQNSVNYMMDLKYFCQHFDIKTNIIDEKLKMNTMEENILYGIVNKVFKRIFDKQKYRNTFEIYRVNGTNMNNDSSKTYLKINDWIAHSVIYPQRNLRANEEMLLDDNSDFCDDIGIKLICASLLADNSCAALKCIRKYEKLILQENGNNKKNKKPLLKDNQNNLSEHEMEKIWKNIYVDSDQVTKSNDDPTDNTKNKYYTMESLLNQLATDKYNYRDTVTNLGLDGMGQENIEYTSGSQLNSYSNGSYSSYFMLRYLYIRYLRRKTLSYLNYFRSIERSITISELGLALEGDAKNANVDKKKSDQSDATQENNIDENMNNFGNRLNSNKYIYSSPLEYKMNQVEFMEYESVKNHDDFHTKRDDGIINVIDSDGKIVMYDISLDDLKTVESQISKITSYYVNKNLLKCANLKEKKQTSLNQDRHLIIYDAWKSTCEYFEILQKLVYVYMFCYENIFDKNEKRNMAQTIITMIFKRIRYNLEDDYFLESVQLEIANIDNHIRLVQKVYERIIQDSRKYSKCIVSRGELKVGMYMYNTNDVFDISDHLNTGILTSTHLFEFNFMLAGLSRIYPATLQTFQKICNNSKSVNIDVRLETAIFEQVLLDFTNFNMCEFYDTFVIENIIDVPYIYDPHILVKIIKNLLSNFEKFNMKSQRRKYTIDTYFETIQLLTQYNDLYNMLFESAYLSDIYLEKLTKSSFAQSNMFLKLYKMEYVDKATIAECEKFIPNDVAVEEDTSTSRYEKLKYSIAYNELDAINSGVLDYNDKNKFSQLFIDDHRKTILRDVLVCQITHRNCLISVLSHIYEYEQYFLSTKVNENQVPEKKNETVTRLSFSKIDVEDYLPLSQEAFISINNEKTFLRNKMLIEYFNKYQHYAKRSDSHNSNKSILIQNYCENLQNNIEHYSLRSQLFAVYNSLYLLVKKFPEIAKKYFIFSANLNLSSDITSQSKKSPKNKKKMFYFPKDSKEDLLINIFFIPTNSDIISFYKSPLVKLSENENGGNTSEQDEKNDADSNDTSDEKKKDKIENTYIGRDVLEKHILLITTLNDILNYFYGLVDLGYIEKRNGLMYSSQLTDEKITADWGGIETIYVLMDNLKSDMATIQSNYLKTQLKYAMVRRDYIIYNIDVIIDNYLLNKFLSKGQFKIFKKLKEHSKFPLLNLSNFPQSGIQAVNFSLPSLYRFSKDNFKKHSISELFPNLSYANCQGLYPLQILPHTNISKNLHSILSCLNTLERKIAHAEFIGVSLLQSEAYVQHQSDKVKVTRSCDKTIEKYSFLSLLIEKWKLVKIHRNMWIKRKIKNFNVTHKDISEGVYAYNWEIVIPIYQSIARKNGFLEWSNKIQNIQSNVIDAIPYPPGVSILETVEIEIDNLNGLYQCSMINDVRKKIASDLNFVISEKSHEESNLPIHLWKKSIFQETFSLSRPEIAETFFKNLLKNCDTNSNENNDEYEQYVKISKSQLEMNCINLNNTIMAREKHNYYMYTVFYENLLRSQSTLLLKKDYENKKLKKNLSEMEESLDIKSKYIVADKCHELISEMSALRNELITLKSDCMKMEDVIEKKVKNKYDDLVTNLYGLSYEMHHKIISMRTGIMQNVVNEIENIRAETIEKISQIRNDSNVKKNPRMNGFDSRDSYYKYLQKENTQLSKFNSKIKIINSWKSLQQRKKFRTETFKLQNKIETLNLKLINCQLTYNTDISIHKKQVNALHEAYAICQTDSANLKHILKNKLNIKADYDHEYNQRINAHKMVERERRKEKEIYMEELEKKIFNLNKTLSTDGVSRQNTLLNIDSKRKVKDYKKQMYTERNLKLNAYKQIERMKTQIIRVQSEQYNSQKLLNRPSTCSNVKLVTDMSVKTMPNLEYKLNLMYKTRFFQNRRPKTSIQHQMTEFDKSYSSTMSTSEVFEEIKN